MESRSASNRIWLKLFLMSTLLWSGPHSANAAVASGKSLDECFQGALVRSEVIADQGELIAQAEERYKQSVGAILPNLGLTASYFVQQKPDSLTYISPSTQPLVKLTATQPLFRGFREFAALRQSEKLKTAQEQTAEQARVQLWNDVAANFFNVLSIEKDIANLQAETQLYRKRITELQARVKIGRSRPAEVLTIESSMSAIDAQIEISNGQLRATREMFAFLTGLPADTPIRDTAPELAPLVSVDQFLATMEQRPDIRSLATRLDASEESIQIARGGHLPSADFLGNYYLKRTGVSENVNWDVQATLTLPIYSGGVVNSQVRVAASQARQSELALSRSRRLAAEEIRSLYQTYAADLAQVKTLKVGRDISERNYRTQTSDYRLGLVTNLDVLQALTAYEESERALDRAIFAAKLDRIRLEAASAQRKF